VILSQSLKQADFEIMHIQRENEEIILKLEKVLEQKLIEIRKEEELNDQLCDKYLPLVQQSGK